MIELKDLPEEKQQELLDVKMCCKISENEFEKRFDALSFEDQKYLAISLIDSELDADVLTDEVIVLNDNIIEFLQKPKYRDMMLSCIDDVQKDFEDDDEELVIL